MAENPTTLSLEEKGRIHYHMGYGVTDPVASIQLGFPANPQSGFILDAVLERIPASQSGLIRRLVGILDQIEQLKIEALSRLAAKVVDEITLNADEQDQLDVEYTKWAKRLADVLRAPLNPYCDRFTLGRATLNVRVRQG